MAKLSAITTPSLTFDEGAAPSTPAANDVVIYGKADGLMYSKDDAGTETLMSSGGASGVPAGASFPGSPSTNDLFFRTDHGLIYYYTGTAWHSQQLFTIDMHPLDALTGVTTNHALYGVLPSNLRACYLVAGYVKLIVVSTNSATQYWTFQFTTKASPNTDTNRAAAQTTAADTHTTYYQKTFTFGIALATTELGIGLSATKTLSPGALYLDAVVTYRLIAT